MVDRPALESPEWHAWLYTLPVEAVWQRDDLASLAFRFAAARAALPDPLELSQRERAALRDWLEDMADEVEGAGRDIRGRLLALAAIGAAGGLAATFFPVIVVTIPAGVIVAWAGLEGWRLSDKASGAKDAVLEIARTLRAIARKLR